MNLIFMEGFDTIGDYDDFIEYSAYPSTTFSWSTVVSTTTNARNSGYGMASPRCLMGGSTGGVRNVSIGTALIGSGVNAMHVGGAWRFSSSGKSTNSLLRIQLGNKYTLLWFQAAGDEYKIGVGVASVTYQTANFLAQNVWNHLETTVAPEGSDWRVKVYLNDLADPIVDVVTTPTSATGRTVEWSSWGDLMLDDVYVATATDGILKTPRYGPCFVITQPPFGSNAGASPFADYPTNGLGIANINETSGVHGDTTYRKAASTGLSDEWDVGVAGLPYGLIHAVQLMTYGAIDSGAGPIVPFARRPGQSTKDGAAITLGWYAGYHDLFETNESAQPWTSEDVKTLKGGYRN